MDMRLSENEFEILQYFDRVVAIRADSTLEKLLPKRMFALHLLTHKCDVAVKLTDVGHRAVFHHRCVTSLRSIR